MPFHMPLLCTIFSYAIYICHEMRANFGTTTSINDPLWQCLTIYFHYIYAMHILGQLDCSSVKKGRAGPL